jgi:hypothetical protein
MVTSLTKAAASHEVTGAGTRLGVSNEIVGKGLVPFARGVELADCGTDACTVKAAAVYN